MLSEVFCAMGSQLTIKLKTNEFPHGALSRIPGCRSAVRPGLGCFSSQVVEHSIGRSAERIQGLNGIVDEIWFAFEVDRSIGLWLFGRKEIRVTRLAASSKAIKCLFSRDYWAWSQPRPFSNLRGLSRSTFIIVIIPSNDTRGCEVPSRAWAMTATSSTPLCSRDTGTMDKLGQFQILRFPCWRLQFSCTSSWGATACLEPSLQGLRTPSGPKAWGWP